MLSEKKLMYLEIMKYKITQKYYYLWIAIHNFIKFSSYVPNIVWNIHEVPNVKFA
jgi:hypothetical protein